ncbi:hypothetical protein GCM10023183_12870 [Nibribacter koreensis]|uniref:Outer membrane protein beta-barrel domain-containing protein n=2 Tax=Nibribacter koreensis TaxID=1084519 RepID=A0ABP8FE41_9BACT
MSDEELDQLFRESAEGYEPPFNPSAWADMDKKLDAYQAGKGRGTWYFSALLLLLFLGMLTIPTLYTRYNQQPVALQPSEQGKALVDQDQPEKSAALSTPVDGNLLLEPLQAKRSEMENVPPPAPIRQEKMSHFLPDFPKTSQKRLLSKQLIVRASVLVGKKRPKPSMQITRSSQEGKAQNEVFQVALPEQKQTQFEEGVASDNSQNIVTESNKPQPSSLLNVDSLSQNNQPVMAPVQTGNLDSLPEAEEPVAKGGQFLKYVQVGVAVAPDLTTVKFKEAGKVSPNAGLLVAVPLTKRLSLVTGAVWAKKIYAAPLDEYTMPSGTSGPAYDSYLDAVCHVIDIPVNLSYQVWQKGQNRLAVQAGLSSYIMLSEKYTYSYTATYGYGNPPKKYTKAWEVDNENRHWFQVQNLSVSYARTFPSGISLGVEPFVKIPLSGIGEGKVNLTSAGVFFSTSYTFHLKP